MAPSSAGDDRNDVDLLQAVGEGDLSALGELVVRYQDPLLSLAGRMLGGRGEAEDVVQEAFLRVHRAAAGFRPKARVSTWLYRIVVNLCHDSLRRRRRAPAEWPEDVADPDGIDPSRQAAAREAAQRVRRAVHALPQRQRTALVLHRYQGLKLQEIAEATGWTASTVESLLVRAYRRLRRELHDLE